MEADWSVEIGPEFPVIDGIWEGFVDLRSSPRAVGELEEARKYPVLSDALRTLNGAGSPVLTTKCDVWAIPGEEIDPDEFSAIDDTARAGFACYIDVLERDASRFLSFELHQRRAREITAALRKVELGRSRVDVVVRRAYLGELSGFGLTLYSAGCGSSEAHAAVEWQSALGAAVAATISKAQPETRASSSIG